MSRTGRIRTYDVGLPTRLKVWSLRPLGNDPVLVTLVGFEPTTISLSEPLSIGVQRQFALFFNLEVKLPQVTRTRIELANTTLKESPGIPSAPPRAIFFFIYQLYYDFLHKSKVLIRQKRDIFYVFRKNVVDLITEYL